MTARRERIELMLRLAEHSSTGREEAVTAVAGVRAAMVKLEGGEYQAVRVRVLQLERKLELASAPTPEPRAEVQGEDGTWSPIGFMRPPTAGTKPMTGAEYEYSFGPTRSTMHGTFRMDTDGIKDAAEKMAAFFAAAQDAAESIRRQAEQLKQDGDL